MLDSLSRHRAAIALLALPALAAGVRAESPQIMDEVSVTATREAQPLAETPSSVGRVSGATVRADRPTHPAQIMGQMPGVAVAVTNGEGHTTALRQPFTTDPVYLFLEDGIPTRSTGFFNHNALYEINVPQAAGIEVIKGPGSALYGSDAIAGVVNVLTRNPPATPEAYLSAEAGEFGWRRALAGAGNSFGDHGLRADLNYTSTDGWRDKTAYDRKSGTLRWDRALGNDALLKTVLSFSEIDQETGANSPLVRADFDNNPTDNYLPIAFRKVDALRLSATYERQFGDGLLSITPYYRDNSMDLLASFRLSFDPTLAVSFNKSYGLMAKWRQDFAPLRTRLIAGMDLDYSPGGRLEDRLNVVTSGTGATRRFLDYSIAARIYDYDVSFRGISPYVHGEFSPSERVRVTAGLRYDHLSYDFDNAFSAPVFAAGRFYGQAPDTRVSFNHASPKLGATYALSAHTSAFANYTHGFRAPSESQLFRPSNATSAGAAQLSAQNALDLEPVKSNQLEIGLRGRVGAANYELALYSLEFRDDILSFRDPLTNATETVNAGKTRHRGVELGLGTPLGAGFRYDGAFSYSRQTYVQWLIPGGTDFSGKDREDAPRVLANNRLTWSPRDGTRATLEWVRVGSYWMDQANTTRYEGYDLLNLLGNWRIGKHLALFASVRNLTDERYADRASLSSGTPVFSPGLPRTYYAGIEVNL